MPADSSAVEVTGEDSARLTVEERLHAWVRIFSEIVMLLWAIDIATKGQASEQIKYRWRRWRARADETRRLRIAANHALWEARRIIDEAGK